MIDAFAEAFGGQHVRSATSGKTVNGYVWFDDEQRAFLVERMANPQGPECEKRVFLSSTLENAHLFLKIQVLQF